MTDSLVRNRCIYEPEGCSFIGTREEVKAHQEAYCTPLHLSIIQRDSVFWRLLGETGSFDEGSAVYFAELASKLSTLGNLQDDILSGRRGGQKDNMDEDDQSEGKNVPLWMNDKEPAFTDGYDKDGQRWMFFQTEDGSLYKEYFKAFTREGDEEPVLWVEHHLIKKGPRFTMRSSRDEWEARMRRGRYI